jgi:hypothetical protein
VENLPALPWASISPWTLLAAAIIGLLTGKLIPWVVWKAWQSLWKERLAEAREENVKLHKIIAKNTEALDLYNSQLKELSEAAKVTERLLASLRAGEVSKRAVVEVVDPPSQQSSG